jgi:hypothetical protein
LPEQQPYAVVGEAFGPRFDIGNLDGDFRSGHVGVAKSPSRHEPLSVSKLSAMGCSRPEWLNARRLSGTLFSNTGFTQPCPLPTIEGLAQF